MKKQVATIYCILAMLTIWWTWNSVGTGKLNEWLSKVNTEQKLISRHIGDLIDRVDSIQLKEPDVKSIIKEIEEGEKDEIQ